MAYMRGLLAGLERKYGWMLAEFAGDSAPDAHGAADWYSPVAQCALVDPKIPGNLRDRLTSLPDQPDRALLEVLIDLPS